MQELYGEDWAYQLALAQAPEPEEEGGLDGDDAQDEEPGRRSAAGSPSVSPAPGAEQTRRVWRSTSPQTRTTNEDGERSLARAGDSPAARLAAGSTDLDGPREPDSSELSRYDPVREPLESYQSRIRRQSAALAQIRDPIPDGALDLALQFFVNGGRAVSAGLGRPRSSSQNAQERVCVAEYFG